MRFAKIVLQSSLAEVLNLVAQINLVSAKGPKNDGFKSIKILKSAHWVSALKRNVWLVSELTWCEFGAATFLRLLPKHVSHNALMLNDLHETKRP